MNRRFKSFAPAIAVALLAFLVATVLGRGMPEPDAPVSDQTVTVNPSSQSPSSPPAAIIEPSAPTVNGEPTRAYAIATSDLAGLPPDPQPGARLDIWVTWSPPVVSEVRIQKLIPGLVLEKVAPPVTPSGSAAAVFLVPVKNMSDLLWADRFGELSVTGIP